MKKEAIFILTILTISLAFAAPVLELQNQDYQTHETIIGTISTNEFAKQIQKSDIQFFEGRKQVFFEHDIKFYNKTHYLYITIPRQGNFTMKINNILYKNPTLAETTITKEFQIKTNYEEEYNETSNQTKQNSQILSVKPGFVFTSTNAEIILSNKGNTPLEINYEDEEEEEQTINLEPNDFQTITFKPKDSFSEITFSTYKEFTVPIFYTPLISENKTSQNITSENKLKPNPKIISLNLNISQEYQKQIELVNFADNPIENISIKNPISFLEISFNKTMPAKSVQNITLNFESPKSGHLQDKIIFTYLLENQTQQFEIPVSIYIFEENQTIEDLNQTKETCEDLNGNICDYYTQDCSGEEVFTSSGEFCCLADCVESENSLKEESSYGWLIGIGIFFVLGIIGFLTYKKYKKTQPKKPEQDFKEKSKLYQNRVTGKLTKN